MGEMEVVQNFLTSPNLPDIIAYVVGAIILIYQIFAKLNIKKDNKNTAAKISIDVAGIAKINDTLAKEREALERDKIEFNKSIKAWEQEKIELLEQIDAEKLELQKQMDEIKKSVRLMSRCSKELVQQGVSRKINQMLPVDEEEINIAVGSDEDNQEVNRND